MHSKLSFVHSLSHEQLLDIQICMCSNVANHLHVFIYVVSHLKICEAIIILTIHNVSLQATSCVSNRRYTIHTLSAHDILGAYELYRVCLSLLTTDEQQLKFNYNKNKVIVYRYALFRVIKINI